tara:strand:- start:95 stop:679 length:585 start_codon:yes stop_codon:yes gene_type:complete
MKKLKEFGSGAFRPGREISGSHTKAIGYGGPSSNADSVMSQRMQYNVGDGYVPPEAEMEYDDMEDDETEIEYEDIILECRVYKLGKYCLIETLENISEIDSRDINAMDKKLSSAAQSRSSSINNLLDLDDLLEEDELQEFSGAGAIGGGPATPIGYTAKGKPETRAQRKKRQKFNITKSFPYTKLANTPRRRKK